MSLFSKVKQGMLESTKAIKDISSDVTEMTKLKVTLSKDKVSVEEFYYDLGKKVYEFYSQNEGDPLLSEDIKMGLANIEATLKRINLAESQIASLKGIIKCNQCGYVVEEGAKFCANCGNKLDQPVIIIPTEETLPDKVPLEPSEEVVEDEEETFLTEEKPE